MNELKPWAKTKGANNRHAKTVANGDNTFVRSHITSGMELPFIRVWYPTKQLSINFCQYPLTGTSRIRGTSHLATDHQVVGPVLYGLSWCGYPFLVSCSLTYGADAWSNQNRLRTREFTHSSNFQRRTDNA